MKDEPSVRLIQSVLFGQGADGPLQEAFWARTLKIASRNRVLYYFASELEHKYNSAFPAAITGKVKDIVAQADAWQQKLKNTLLFIRDKFQAGGIPFLVVKTRRDIPYVTYDVDVLVREPDFPRVNRILQGQGKFGRHPGKQAQNQMNFFGADLLTIDIHKDFSWQGFTYLDKEAAWSGQTQARIAGVDLAVPCAEVEFLLYAAHIIYERRHITLLDLNNLVSLSKQIKNPELIREQVKKFGWERSFTKLLSLMNAITREIYPFRKDEFTFLPLPRLDIKGRWEMPYFIPPFMVAGFFREKSIFEKRIPFWDIAYYIFATGRYYLAGRRQFPYYLEWYRQ